MHNVIENLLWIGNAADARDKRLLNETGISAVVDVAYEEAPATLSRETIYVRVPLLDGTGNSPEHLHFAVNTLLLLLAAKQPTLVSCSAGMSRSVAIAAMSWSIFSQTDPEQVLQSIAAQQPHDVSTSFWQDLCEACQFLLPSKDEEE